ncbi:MULTISPECIES: hypothetical protein [Dyella]|uniref:Terminase small subunit n=2 Tax=Dyella TaxID=231454 RepID=A0A4R0YUZ4_9GAMM|nr:MULTISPECIES: hypothetical protein [Dyella]TBR39270.1 hypothetical protein EYV96_03325 [Dyella terrae]TCI13142.1 hypothetical protein EZM97_07540 [Dyella soli]
MKRGLTGVQAAIEAGYAEQSAKHAAYQLTHDNKLVMAELERIDQEFSEKCRYYKHQAALDLDGDIAAAQTANQYSAVAKFRELKMRMFNLIREKVDVTVERIDLAGAMAEAKARVRPMRDPDDIIDVMPLALTGPTANGPIDNKSIAHAGWPELDLNL